MNDVIKRFFVHAFVASILTSLLFVYKYYILKDDMSLWKSVLAVFIGTFIITSIVYIAMNYLTGFGTIDQPNILPMSVGAY